jgi:glycerophosphoryl diester phosphodiesterase
VTRPAYPVVRVAHRGASGLCPENTRLAFERAIALGVDLIETDRPDVLNAVLQAS